VKLETTLDLGGFSWTPAGAGEKPKPESLALTLHRPGGTEKEAAKAVANVARFLSHKSASEHLVVAIAAAELEGAAERTTWEGRGRLTGGAWIPSKEDGGSPGFRLTLKVSEGDGVSVSALMALRHRMSAESTTAAAVQLEPFQGELFEDDAAEAEP